MEGGVLKSKPEITGWTETISYRRSRTQDKEEEVEGGTTGY